MEHGAAAALRLPAQAAAGPWGFSGLRPAAAAAAARPGQGDSGPAGDTGLSGGGERGAQTLSPIELCGCPYACPAVLCRMSI